MLTRRDKDILIYLENHKAITVKQAQTIFFEGNYEGCRRRLNELLDMKVLKSYISKLTNQKVFYIDKKVSDHDLLVLEVHCRLIKEGCKIRKFRKSDRYLNDLIRPDAFIEFEYNNNLFFVLLEVDHTHYTGIDKFKMYEKLYREEELQKECYGTFPILIIMRATNNDIRYSSKLFDVIYLDFTLDKLNDLLLNPYF